MQLTYTETVSYGTSAIFFYPAEEGSILSIELTAHRPTTEGPAYGIPFQDHEVPDDEEENPGAGIRINGDTETAANENDLIEVELEVGSFPVPSGVQYFLRRNNSNIKVWNNQQMGTALLDSGTEAAFTVTASPMSVWVENPSGGNADFELVAKDSGGNDVCSDKIHFYPFTSVVIVFEGEFGVPADPPQTGISQLALDIYENGYDVHLYEEPDLGDNPNAEDDAFAEIENAVDNRQVNSVAIIGYSHGGGSTFNVSEDMDNDPTAFNLNFTAYIDAVTQGSIAQENRRPVNSAFHVNYYQEGSLADGWLDGGPIDNPPGANHEVNVDEPVATETHTTIDDDAAVHAGITTRLYQQINR